MRVNGALVEDRLCRTCRYAVWDVGYPKHFSKKVTDVVVCKVGCFEKGVEWRLRMLPLTCRYYRKMKGEEEHMGLLDFSGKSQRELEEELRRIRDERSGRGKARRKVVRDKKVKAAATKKEYIQISLMEDEVEEI